MLFLVQAVVLLAFVISLALFTYYCFTKWLGSSRTLAIVFTTLVAAASGAALAYGSFISARIHLFEDSQELWSGRLTRAFNLNPRVLFWALAPMLYGLFLSLYFTGILLITLLFGLPIGRLMTHAPLWARDVVHAVAIVLELFLFVLGFFLCFRAVKWIWSQQDQVPSSGAVREKTDA